MRRKHQIFGLSLKDYESLEDAQAAAQLGKLLAYRSTFRRLSLHHAKLRQIEYFWGGVPHPVRWDEDPLPEIWEEKEALEKQLAAEMIDAVSRNDAAYFKALGEMMDLLNAEPRSPAESVLIHLLQFRSPEGHKRLLEWAGTDPARLEDARVSMEDEGFIRWPASISEIWEYARQCWPDMGEDKSPPGLDKETIRKAANRLGFPYRDETYPGSKKFRE